jgi:glycosyltransferase involved in cell wall biosynthesis
MSKKMKILTLSDHPLSPSGVGTQTRYIIEGLLKTGKYQFLSFGGAIKHNKYEPQRTEEWGDDWLIWPVDGYGTQDQLRAIIHQQRPDMLWFMTDPRFYGWLWQIENEVRAQMPMVYYHVWDNYPYPTFNKINYSSNDHIACISKVTYDIVKTVAPGVDVSYIPHAVDTEIFKSHPDEDIKQFRADKLKGHQDKFLLFWNNRNARRKQSGSLIFWFNDFLNKVGRDKATLIMHTDPKDVHGQDLEAIIHELGMSDGEVLFSKEKVDAANLAIVYNMVDCTINISDAEGFGLSTLESMACGTPIIATITGGLQDQLTDGEDWYGIGIEPASKAIIGSQEVPWIYEDRLNGNDVVDALVKMYELGDEGRNALGLKGQAHVEKAFNFDKYAETWDDLIMRLHEEHGSWETRTGYQPYEVREF